MTESDGSNSFRVIVEEVLNSHNFRNTLQNAMSRVSTPNLSNASTSSSCLQSWNSTPSSTPSSSSQRLVESEVRRLFPSVGHRNNSLKIRGKKRALHTNSYTEFRKEVILLKSAKIEKTLSGREKHKAYKDGFAMMAVSLNKQWTYQQIETHLRNVFKEKIPISVTIELLVPVARFLVKPTLPDGDSLDGETLSKIFAQKSIYIRPSTTLEEDDVDVVHNIIDYNTYDIYDDAELDVRGEPNPNHSNDSDILNEPVNQEYTPTTSQTEDANFERDVQLAISNSLKDHQNGIESNIKDILLNLNTKIRAEPQTNCNIFRAEAYNCFVRVLKRKKFCPENKLSIIFTDIDGTTEGAIDAGGPTRELFRLLLNHIQNSRIFEGPEYNKYLNLVSEALDDREYFMAGQIIAMSIVHGGPGPGFFSKMLFNFLLYGDATDLELSIDDINDNEVKTQLMKILSSQDLSELQTAVDESPMLSLAGFTYIKNFECKHKVINGALKFYFVYRLHSAVEQFRDGLKTLDVFDKIKQYPEEFKQIMCKTINNVNGQMLQELFTVNYSEAGSNRRADEARVLAYWLDYLLECDEPDAEVTARDILCFASGLTDLPPMGFLNKPQLKFLHEDTSPFPKGNTCAIELYLPIVHSFEIFKKNMDFGIKNGMEFGFT